MSVFRPEAVAWNDIGPWRQGEFLDSVRGSVADPFGIDPADDSVLAAQGFRSSANATAFRSPVSSTAPASVLDSDEFLDQICSW